GRRGHGPARARDRPAARRRAHHRRGPWMLPTMADAQVAQQTACLRPVASDGLLVLGCVPGLDQVYVATGGARKGILYGPAMGHAIADLVLGRDTRVALDAFAPGRFAGVRE